MTRLLLALSGLLLIAIAFFAATMVADTREGLIAEVVTLLGGLVGIGLLLYGLVPRRARSAAGAPTIEQNAARQKPTSARSANDLVIGMAGIALSLVLLGGLAISGGWLWALLGGALLIPMTAGSAYLVIAFARAPQRDWSVDLARLLRSRARPKA